MSERRTSELIRLPGGPVVMTSTFGHVLSPEHARVLEGAQQQLLREIMERHEQRRRELRRGRPPAAEPES